LFDQAVLAREDKAERRMREALTERGRSGEDRQPLSDDPLEHRRDGDPVVEQPCAEASRSRRSTHRHFPASRTA
jgi:hypothetical protein